MWRVAIVDTMYYLHRCEPTSEANERMVAMEIERRYGLHVTILKSLPPLR